MALKALILIAMVIWNADASHFRGGTISWEHLGATGSVHHVRFSFRLGWRRDSGQVCDANVVASKISIFSGGNWVLSGATSPDFPHSTGIICTTYDIAENWAYGYNSFTANISNYGTFTVKYTGAAWIGSMAIGSNSGWSVGVHDVDLNTRSDTGMVNHPPSTLSSPVAKLQLGCPTSIKINSLDKDNDRLSCRYGSNSGECGGICGQYLHFSLNESTCTIHYDGGGAATMVPVALMLEDHPWQAITRGGRVLQTSDVLSSIPLQFLVNISHTNSCNMLPTYPPSTIQENANITIARAGSLNVVLLAYPSDLNLTIAQFVVIGPTGLNISDIYNPSFGLFAANITWKPDSSQGGEHLICYFAVDSIGKSGRQICFTVNAAAISSPCEVENGGCNDICVPMAGSTHICECSSTCWTLAGNRKTCIPNLEVTCSGNDITISIEKCASNRTVVAASNFGHFTQGTCQSVETPSKHILNFGILDCGLNIQTNPIVIQYSTNVWIYESVDSPSAVVTRGEWRNIPVTCSIPRSGNLTGSFVPIPPLNDEFFPDEIEIPGWGQFSLYFEYYRTNSFLTSYPPGDFPIQVKVNDELYFSLGAVGRGGLVFFTERCVASSDTNSNSQTYTFIENGCLIDPTLIRHSAPNAMQNRFSMRAFEFEEKLLVSRQDAEITIQCQVMLCDAANNSTRCAQGCLSTSGRRKRSIADELGLSGVKYRGKRNTDDDEEKLPDIGSPESNIQKVDSRFVLTSSSNDDDGQSQNNSDLAVMGALIGMAVVILAIVIFIAYRLEMKRRKSATVTQKQPDTANTAT